MPAPAGPGLKGQWVEVSKLQATCNNCMGLCARVHPHLVVEANQVPRVPHRAVSTQ